MANQDFVFGAKMDLRGPTPADLAIIKKQVNSQLRGASINVAAKIPQDNIRQLQQLKTAIRQVGSESRTAGENIEEFGRRVGIAGKRYLAFSLATVGVIKALGAFRNATSEAVDFEKQIIRIAQVSGRSIDQLSGLRAEILKIGSTFGVSSNEISEAAVTLAQTGRPIAEVKKDLEAIGKAKLSPTFGNAKDTVEGLIAVQRQFQKSGLTTTEILSKLNSVAGQFPVESSDLITAVKKTGGAFQAAGGSLEELLALFTSVRSTTRESADTIGTAFRTITGRLGRIKTINFFKDVLDVDLIKDGKILAPFQAIEKIFEGLNKKGLLTDAGKQSPLFSSIVEELGGIRQRAKVIPLLLQFAEAQKVLNLAMQSGDSITKDAAQAQEGLGVQVTKVREEFQRFVDGVLKDPAFRTFASELLSIASGLIKVADSAKPLIPLIGILGGGFAFKALSPLLRGIAPTVPTIKGFAKGGLNTGTGKIPGVGSRDTEIFAGMPGEYIIKKSSVIKYGTDFLDEVNAGQIPKMAQGGGLGPAPRGSGERDSEKLDRLLKFRKSIYNKQRSLNDDSDYEEVLRLNLLQKRTNESIAKIRGQLKERQASYNERLLREYLQPVTPYQIESVNTRGVNSIQPTGKALHTAGGFQKGKSLSLSSPTGKSLPVIQPPIDNSNEPVINIRDNVRARRPGELLPVHQSPSKIKRQGIKRRRGIITGPGSITGSGPNLPVIPNNYGEPEINLGGDPPSNAEIRARILKASAYAHRERTNPDAPDGKTVFGPPKPLRRYAAGLVSKKENRKLELPIGTFKGIEKEVNRLAKVLGVNVSEISNGIQDFTATQKQEVRQKLGSIPNASFNSRTRALSFNEKTATSGSVREELIHAQDFKLGGKGKKFASEIVGTLQNNVVQSFLPQIKREVEKTADKRGLTGKVRERYIANRTSGREVFASVVRRQPEDVQRALLRSTSGVARGPLATNANLRGVTGKSKKFVDTTGKSLPFVPIGPPRPPKPPVPPDPYGPFPRRPRPPFDSALGNSLSGPAISRVPIGTSKRRRNKNPFSLELGKGGATAAAGVLGVGVLNSALLDDEQAAKFGKTLGLVAVQFGILNQALQNSVQIVSAKANQEKANVKLAKANLVVDNLSARNASAKRTSSDLKNKLLAGKENLRQGLTNKQQAEIRLSDSLVKQEKLKKALKGQRANKSPNDPDVHARITQQTSDQLAKQKQITSESKKQLAAANKRIEAGHKQNNILKQNLKVAKEEVKVSDRLVDGAKRGRNKQRSNAINAAKATRKAEFQSQAALFSSVAATAVGSFIADAGQEKLVAGDKSGTALAVGGGALQLAGIGAGLGAIFGPLGAGVGAAAGATIGFVSSLKNAKKTLENFAKERILEASELSRSKKEKLTTEEIKGLNLSKVLQTEQGTVDAAKGKSGIAAYLGLAFTGGSIENIDVNLTKFLKDEAKKYTSIEEFNKAYETELASIKQYTGVGIAPQIEAIIKQSKEMATATKDLQRALYNNMDQVDGFLGEITNRLSQNKGRRANIEFLSTGNIGDFQGIAGDIQNVKNIGGLKERDLLNAKALALGESFDRTSTGRKRIHTANNTQDSSKLVGTGIGGNIAKEFAEYSNAIPQLKTFSEEIFNAGEITKEQFEQIKNSNFGHLSGITADKIDNALEQLFGEISDTGFDGADFAPLETFNKLAEAAGGNAVAALTKLAEVFTNQSNLLSRDLAAQRAIGNQIFANRQTKINVDQQGSDILSNQLGTSKSFLGEARTRKLLTGGLSANQLGGRLRQSNQNILSLQQERDSVILDDGKIKEINNKLSAELTARERLVGGLQYLTNVSITTAKAVSDFQKAEENRLAKKSILEKKLTGTPEERRAIERSETLLGQFKGDSGVAQNVSTKTFSELLSFAKEFGDAIVPQTGKTGKQTADDLLISRAKGQNLGVGSKLSAAEQARLNVLESKTDGKSAALFGDIANPKEIKVNNPITKRQKEQNARIDRDIAERDALRIKGQDAAAREVITGAGNKAKLTSDVDAATKEGRDAASQLFITLNDQFQDLGKIASESFDRAFRELREKQSVIQEKKPNSNDVGTSLQIDGKININVSVTGISDLDNRLNTIAAAAGRRAVEEGISRYAKENNLPPFQSAGTSVS